MDRISGSSLISKFIPTNDEIDAIFETTEHLANKTAENFIPTADEIDSLRKTGKYFLKQLEKMLQE